MFKDQIQERLREMEKYNPSENEHRQGFFKSLSDKFYFLSRYFNEQIERVPGKDFYFSFSEEAIRAADSLRKILEEEREKAEEKGCKNGAVILSSYENHREQPQEVLIQH